MTTIKATCESCGDVVLGVPDVDLHASTGTPSAWYTFVCPVCEEPVIKEASPAAVTALVNAGCHTRSWAAPADIAPISAQDVAEFRRAIRRAPDSSMIARLVE